MTLKAARRSRISPFIVMDVMRAANARDQAAKSANERAIHLEVGQPGTPAPLLVREAATRALAQERLGYTEAFGMPVLRARIARHYKDRYGVDVPVERVVVTTGSSGAFLLGFLAAFDAGDKVALADPGYPAYRNILQALDVVPVGVAAEIDTRFQPVPAALDKLDGKIAGLIVASPANPTGSMLAPAELSALASWCQKHGVRLVSDEIYHGITYGMDEATALEFSDDGDRHQQLLEILFDDRMAAGLDDRAARSAACRRGAGAESVHLAADPGAGGSTRRVRCDGGARCQCRALQSQSRLAAVSVAASRVHALRAG